jgi:hypothetical protein
MRDIRSDLLERANLAQDRIKAADVHFERMVEQLRNEHDASVADLKAGLARSPSLKNFTWPTCRRTRLRRRRLPNMRISHKNLDG